MARKPRIHFKDAAYHVVLKGLDGATLFKSKKDRLEWEALVEEGCARFGHQIHAYCWLKDQVNLSVRVKDIPLSRIMQNLSFRYTRYFNKRHGVDGPLFHGRYKAILIDPSEYLNELTRYIHNLPVVHTSATNAADYAWSSHRSYLGKESTPWLSTDEVLTSFGSTKHSAVSVFKKFVDSAKREEGGTDLARGVDGGRILGNKKFQQKALTPRKQKVKTVTIPQLVRYICKEEGVTEASLKTASRARYESELRQLITCVAMELDVATLTDMARRFNRDLTTMSRNQRYFREKMAENTTLQRTVNGYKKALIKH